MAHNPTLVTFQWSPPPPIDVNGILLHYSVLMTETETGRSWSFIAVDTSLSVGSLHPHYIYSGQIAAFTIGLGPYTNLFYVQTQESGMQLSSAIVANLARSMFCVIIAYPSLAPTSSPTRPEINSFDSTSVRLSWQPPPFEETNGIIRYYTILVTELDTGDAFEVISNKTNTTIGSLHPFYTHTFKVRAETVAPGPYSSESSVTLEEEGNTNPCHNAANNINTNLFSLFLSSKWATTECGWSC